MPIFQLDTNVPKHKITKEFLKSTVKVIADTLNKPANRVVVHINPDQLIAMGDENEPCGIARLRSIGKLGVKENKNHAKAITEHLNKTLGIPIERLKIHFIDVPASDIGSGNTTYHYILSGL